MFESPIGAPISCVSAAAISGIRFWYAAMMRSSSARRSSTLVCEKVRNARFAAATARSTSAALAIAIVAISCSLAGLMTFARRSLKGSTHSPSM